MVAREPNPKLDFAVHERGVFLHFDLVLELQVSQLPLSPQVEFFVVVLEHCVGSVAVEAGNQLREGGLPAEAARRARRRARWCI